MTHLIQQAALCSVIDLVVVTPAVTVSQRTSLRGGKRDQATALTLLRDESVKMPLDTLFLKFENHKARRDHHDGNQPPLQNIDR